MKGIGFAFFLVAVVCVTGGMLWGLEMAATDDHSMTPAHAHLNLVGWVTMGLFGIYYTITPQAAASGLSKIHFVLATAGVAMMVPGIALTLAEINDGLVVIGSLVTFSSMLVFLFTVYKHGLGRPA